MWNTSGPKATRPRFPSDLEERGVAFLLSGLAEGERAPGALAPSESLPLDRRRILGTRRPENPFPRPGAVAASGAVEPGALAASETLGMSPGPFGAGETSEPGPFGASGLLSLRLGDRSPFVDLQALPGPFGASAVLRRPGPFGASDLGFKTLSALICLVTA